MQAGLEVEHGLFVDRARQHRPEQRLGRLPQDRRLVPAACHYPVPAHEVLGVVAIERRKPDQVSRLGRTAAPGVRLPGCPRRRPARSGAGRYGGPRAACRCRPPTSARSWSPTRTRAASYAGRAPSGPAPRSRGSATACRCRRIRARGRRRACARTARGGRLTPSGCSAAGRGTRAGRPARGGARTRARTRSGRSTPWAGTPRLPACWHNGPAPRRPFRTRTCRCRSPGPATTGTSVARSRFPCGGRARGGSCRQREYVATVLPSASGPRSTSNGTARERIGSRVVTPFICCVRKYILCTASYSLHTTRPSSALTDVGRVNDAMVLSACEGAAGRADAARTSVSSEARRIHSREHGGRAMDAALHPPGAQ